MFCLSLSTNTPPFGSGITFELNGAALFAASEQGDIFRPAVSMICYPGSSSLTSMSINFSNRLCLVSGLFALVKP